MKDTLRSCASVVRLSWRTDRKLTAGTIALALGEHSTSALGPLWMKVLIDGVVDKSITAATIGGLLLASRWLVSAGCHYGNMIVLGRLADRTGQAIAEDMYRVSAGLPGIEHFERPDYLNRLQLLHGERALLGSFIRLVVGAVGFVVRAAVTLVLLVSLHPALLLIPVFGTGSIIAGKRVQQMREKLAWDLAEPRRRLGHLVEIATSRGYANEVRVFDLADEVVSRQTELDDELRRTELRGEAKMHATRAAGQILLYAGSVGAVAFVLVRALRGSATAGDVVMTLNLAGQVTGLTGQSVQVLSGTMAAAAAMGRYQWLEDYAAEAHRRSSPALPPPSSLLEGIELHGVSFAYPGTDGDVLTDVDLKLPAGSTVAVIGENGAGKTTLVKLLCGFFEPTKGEITVDGVGMSSLDVVAWRSRTTAAFQDFSRFEFLLRESVGVGNLPNVEDADAVGLALQRADGSDLLTTLPGGLASQLGISWPGGVELSGGQWQKLGLARAMMRDTPLLVVLDEPTSALDAQAEHALFERYAGAARESAARSGAITVLISHRFSTVRMADLIVVIDEGRVVEAGAHEDLMARRGLYAELYELQAAGYR